MTNLSTYKAKSGMFEAVWTLEIQTVADDVDRILDAVMAVYPLPYGNYRRTASVSAPGYETAQPNEGSTTTTHLAGYTAGGTQTYAMVEVKISIPRDESLLANVMDAILYVHHYEEPVIFLRDDWASRAAYNPNNTNPNRWWNNGRGMADPLS